MGQYETFGEGIKMSKSSCLIVALASKYGGKAGTPEYKAVKLDLEILQKTVQLEEMEEFLESMGRNKDGSKKLPEPPQLHKV
jgi:hypothetical protein